MRRLRYWLKARRCTCRGYPRRFAGGTVQESVMVANGDGTVRAAQLLHRTDGPCYECDTYGRPLP